jgi:peptidoglycan hydrolase-like protein with peptidoglycan-binding domain
MMVRATEEGFCARLAPGTRWQISPLTGLVVVFVTALVAIVPTAPVYAADWDSWLQKQGDKIYEDTKKVIQEYSPPAEEADDASKSQAVAVPKPQPKFQSKSQPKQPPVKSAAAPRYDKPWVTEIQTHLTGLGYNPGPADGAFGNKSKMAIIAFQQQRGDQVTGLPTPSVMQALRGASQAALSNPDPSINNPSPAAGGQAVKTAKAVSSPPVLTTQNLMPLAGYAGDYAAWADACSDPAGVTVTSDFLSKADVLAPDEKASVIQRFDSRYATKNDYVETLIEKCTGMGRTTCCTAGRTIPKRFAKAKMLYEFSLQSLTVAASPAAGSGSSTASVVIAPTSPAVSEANAASTASPTAVPTSSSHATASMTSSHIPATPHALDILVSYASNYAGWAAACGEPVTVKQDYLAAANLLAPEYRDHRIKMFNLYFSEYFNRIKKAKDFFANPVSRSGQYEEGAIDPCTSADGDDHKKKYETALLAVQKADAAAKSQAAEKIKAKAEALSAANTPPQSSRVKKISKADLEPAAIQWSQLASWGVTDGTIMACTGVRDTMIRHNIMVMFDVAKIRERDIERLKETYDNGFTQYSKLPCGVGLPVNSVPPAEQVYAKYLKFQNYVLKCSAIIKTTPKGHDYNCGQ